MSCGTTFDRGRRNATRGAAHPLPTHALADAWPARRSLRGCWDSVNWASGNSRQKSPRRQGFPPRLSRQRISGPVLDAPAFWARATIALMHPGLCRMSEAVVNATYFTIRTAFAAASQVTLAPVASPILRSGSSRLPLTMMPCLRGMRTQVVSLQI